VREMRWARATPSKMRTLVLEPPRGWRFIDFRELWRYRELLYFLVWRNVKVRYKQTVLGASWAIIQPFATMVVFTLIFGGLAKIPSDDIPYPILSYSALVPWTFFANGLTRVSTSLVSSASLISKVYLPRLVIPISAVLSNLVDFALAFIVLVGMMVFYRVMPTLAILWLPLFLLLATATCLGVGLWLSAMYVQVRDIGYAVPFLIRLWMFATPVVYPSSLVPEKWRVLLGLNPMTGVIEGFRWALLGNTSPPSSMIFASVGVAAFLLVSGALYFRRMEKSFADVM